MSHQHPPANILVSPRRRKASRTISAAMLATIAICATTSLTAAAEDAAVKARVIGVAGQEDKTVPVTDASMTVFDGSGWNCSTLQGNSPEKVTLICRHNNAEAATAFAVNCSDERMRLGNMTLMSGLSRVATVALICTNQ